MRHRNKYILAALITLLLAANTHAAINPFTGAEQTTKEPVEGKPSKKAETPPPPIPGRGGQMPPALPTSAMPPGLPGAYNPLQGPGQQTTPAAKTSRWKILGKLGDDQVALQGEGDDIVIHRDGSYIESCYVLHPDISCDEATIAGMKTKRNATVTMERLKTDLEIERANTAKLRKQLASVTDSKDASESTGKRLVESNNELKAALAASKNKLAEKETEVKGLQAKLKDTETQSKHLTTVTAANRLEIGNLNDSTAVLKKQVNAYEGELKKGASITTLTEEKKKLEVKSAADQKTLKEQKDRIVELQTNLTSAQSTNKLLTAQLDEIRNTPPKIVEKIVVPQIPEWMKGTYSDATIGGVPVGMRMLPEAVIIRVPVIKWKDVAKSLAGKYTDEWEDGTQKYAYVRQGSFDLAPAPAAPPNKKEASR